MSDLCELSLEDAASLIRERAVSSRELTEACLARLEAIEPRLHAFITPTPERALRDAREADSLNASGRYRGPLHGVPLSVKDVFDVAGLPTTAGSSFLRIAAAADSDVVSRLTASGAVLLGKTNLHEFAFGATSDNPWFGAVANPWALDRIPGGSSGGSAVAVATGTGFGSIGTDTGGSVRIPAALCGVVGFKPTQGRISLRGVIPLSSTLDHVGVLARSTRDAATLYWAIARHQTLHGEPTWALSDPLAKIEGGIRGARIGIWRRALLASASDVVAAVEAAAREFALLGASLDEVEFPRSDELAQVQSLITNTDAYAYHRRWLCVERRAYGADVRARILRGQGVTAADYASARQARTEIIAAFDEDLRKYDAIILPTTVTTAPLRDAPDSADRIARLHVLTAPFNLTGLPAITMPASVPKGLPIGVQLVGRRWTDAALFRLARAYEKARGSFTSPTSA